VHLANGKQIISSTSFIKSESTSRHPTPSSLQATAKHQLPQAFFNIMDKENPPSTVENIASYYVVLVAGPWGVVWGRGTPVKKNGGGEHKIKI
jgi:hypothetical protein